MKSLTEIRRWATLRCAHCGHRFRWARDPRSSFGIRDGEIYHGPCIAYLIWRSKADERLLVLGLAAKVAGLDTLALQGVAFARADAGQENEAQNRVWRVFYDLSKATDQEIS